jgi:hypothetical protein
MKQNTRIVLKKGPMYGEKASSWNAILNFKCITARKILSDPHKTEKNPQFSLKIVYKICFSNQN